MNEREKSILHNKLVYLIYIHSLKYVFIHVNIVAFETVNICILYICMGDNIVFYTIPIRYRNLYNSMYVGIAFMLCKEVHAVALCATLHCKMMMMTTIIVFVVQHKSQFVRRLCVKLYIQIKNTYSSTPKKEYIYNNILENLTILFF